MKVAAAVVLYHPDAELNKRVRSYAGAVGAMFLMDNTEGENTIASHSIPGSRYFSDGRNEGIANRLNAAAKLALAEGYEWLLTMDQDSAFAAGVFDHYLQCAGSHPSLEEVAIFGVSHGRDYLIGEDETCNTISTRHIITSGSLVDLSVWKKVGGFDEALFIDQVDFEYAYRCAKAGYETLVFPQISMQHAIGTAQPARWMGVGKRGARIVHSPVRLYYMVRNFLYVQYRYGHDFPKELADSRRDLLVRIKNNVFYSGQAWSALKAMLAGARDAQRGRMGKRA